jgi:hypothetical protein
MYKHLKKLNFITVIQQSTMQYFSFSSAAMIIGCMRPRMQIKVHFIHKHIAQEATYVRHLTALSFRHKAAQLLAMLTVTQPLYACLYSEKLYIGA